MRLLRLLVPSYWIDAEHPWACRYRNSTLRFMQRRQFLVRAFLAVDARHFLNPADPPFAATLHDRGVLHVHSLIRPVANRSILSPDKSRQRSPVAAARQGAAEGQAHARAYPPGRDAARGSRRARHERGGACAAHRGTGEPHHPDSQRPARGHRATRRCASGASSAPRTSSRSTSRSSTSCGLRRARTARRSPGSPPWTPPGHARGGLTGGPPAGPERQRPRGEACDAGSSLRGRGGHDRARSRHCDYRPTVATDTPAFPRTPRG